MATITSPKLDNNHDQPTPNWNLLSLLRNWINGIQVKNAKFAHLICKLIPCTCPFERDVNFLGRLLFHIPPLCKLNPLYDELVALRWRALCFLADVCGEDIGHYIC